MLSNVRQQLWCVYNVFGPIWQTHQCVFVCRPGAGFLLQAEGAWLPDEERAGSFGNHPAEPALDGQEPAHAPKISLTLVLCLSFALFRGCWGVSSR